MSPEEKEDLYQLVKSLFRATPPVPSVDGTQYINIDDITFRYAPGYESQITIGLAVTHKQKAFDSWALLFSGKADRQKYSWNDYLIRDYVMPVLHRSAVLQALADL